MTKDTTTCSADWVCENPSCDGVFHRLEPLVRRPPAAPDDGLDFAPDASAVCDDCGEDLMGGGPHGAGCPADECEACGHAGGREARLNAYTDRCECGCHWPSEA